MNINTDLITALTNLYFLFFLSFTCLFLPGRETVSGREAAAGVVSGMGLGAQMG